MADEQELPAYPIRAYQLIPDPNQPTTTRNVRAVIE
jgi:hypothetical protein